MGQSRIHWIDIAKAIAMFAIVLGHTLRGGDIQTYLYSFHVPLFFFLSGIFASKVSIAKRVFLKKKTLSLLVPYFIFGFISIGIYLLFGGEAASSLGVQTKDEGNFLSCLIGLLYANGNTGLMKFNLPLWFLPCLFVLEMIFFFTMRLLSKVGFSAQSSAGCILGFFGLLSISNICFFWIWGLPWGLETAVNMLPFYSLGFLFKKHQEVYSKRLRASFPRSVVLVVVILVIGGITSWVNGSVDYVSNAYGNLVLFYIASFSGLLGWVSVSILINQARFVEMIGQSTLITLCVHKFIILLFQTKISITAVPLAALNPFVGVLVALITIVICLLISFFVSKYMPFVLGKPVRSRAD